VTGIGQSAFDNRDTLSNMGPTSPTQETDMLSGIAKPASGILIVLSLAIAVSACGRRGNLEPPPSGLSGYEEADPAREPQERPERPDKPFVLDPLL
jgi:predicted small lipoprotein YifL